MRTLTKKWIVIGIIAAVLLTSRIYDVAQWLQRYDLVYSAREFESVYLTGTSIVIVVVLLFLLRDDPPRNRSSRPFYHHERRDRRDG